MQKRIATLVVSCIAIIGMAALVQPFVRAESCCDSSASASCSGSSACNVCKNCKYCKYCATDGRKCGVCSKKTE